MPILPVVTSKEFLPSLRPEPIDSGTPLTHLTSVRPPRQPTPQAWHGCGVPPALGMWQLSSAWQLEVRPRLSDSRAFWCKAHTNVVSTANCDPPLRGRPSTTTSSLRASATPGIARSKSLMNTFVRTRPLASLLKRESLATQHPNPSARCMMVAKDVEETATWATALRNGKRLSQTTEENYPEQVRRDRCHIARWESCQGCTCSRPCLGPDQSLLLI